MPKAIFTVNNVWTKLECDQQLFDLLDDEFAYFVPGYRHIPAYKAKPRKWDGKRHLLTKYKNFPSGLLTDALHIASDAGYTYTINDQRVQPQRDLRKWNLKGADEREHQEEAYIAAIDAGRGIIHHATGSGKTEIMAAIIQMLDLPAIVMVNQASIATQTQKRLAERLGVKVGLLTGSKKIDGKIVVATFQTLMSQMNNDKENQTKHLKKYLSKFSVLCIDEGHHALATTYQKVANECEAYYRFGFSATPFKSEEFQEDESIDPASRLHLTGTTGPVLDRFTAGEGVEKKLLVPAHITYVKWHPDKPKDWWKAPEFDINDWDYTWQGKKTKLVEKPMGSGKMVRVPLPEKDWEDGLYTIGIAKHTVRNGWVVDAACTLYDRGLATLVLVINIEQGKWLQKNIAKHTGTNVQFLDGTNTDAEREAAKRKFVSGECPVLVATTIFDEGVDVPSIDGLVFAQGGKAQHKVFQRLGRGMRPKAGKTVLEVIDFYDTHSKILWRHANERMKAYKSDKVGYQVEIVEAD